MAMAAYVQRHEHLCLLSPDLLLGKSSEETQKGGKAPAGQRRLFFHFLFKKKKKKRIPLALKNAETAMRFDRKTQ